MEDRLIVRRMKGGEEGEVCLLARRVFDGFVAPDLAAAGIQEFYRYADPRAMRERARKAGTVFVAVEKGRILGMIEIRDSTHIAQLFVEDRGRGVASLLVERACRLCLENADGPVSMTVHSSLYAVPVYQKMGFKAMGPATTQKGITYVPMAMDLEQCS
jgi:GNAT superfamily N-acetyltransferase